MALSASNVSVSFGGIHALRNVSVVVQPGAIVGLVGPNGAGKSTLFNCLSGVVNPKQGSVRLNDEDITHERFDKRIRLGIGRTFQTPRIDLDASVRDAVLLGFHARCNQSVVEAFFCPPSVQRQEREIFHEAEHLIEAFGLTSNPDIRAGELSLGQLRMLEVARALAGRPQYLLLDEPAAGVDGHELKVLASAIRDAAGKGIGVLLVEHNVSFVAALCERMVALVQGEVVVEGPPSVVVKDEKVLRAYLGAKRVAA